jgi:hypothetical protein
MTKKLFVTHFVSIILLVICSALVNVIQYQLTGQDAGLVVGALIGGYGYPKIIEFVNKMEIL